MITDAVNATMVQTLRNGEDNMGMYTDEQLKEWWEELGAITIDDEEQIESDFEISDVIMFEKGTERNEIWSWFDEESSEGLAKLIGLK